MVASKLTRFRRATWRRFGASVDGDAAPVAQNDERHARARTLGGELEAHRAFIAHFDAGDRKDHVAGTQASAFTGGAGIKLADQHALRPRQAHRAR